MRSYAISSSSGSTRISPTRCSGESGESSTGAASTSFSAAARGRDLVVARQPGREQQERAADDEERELGQAGDDRDRADRAAAELQRLLCRVNWCNRSVPRSISVAARVTMRPDDSEMSSAGICATRPSPTVRRLYVLIASPNDRCCLQDADREAADEVDGDDDDGGDRVALHELRGTVHRTVEVGFFGDLAAAALGLVLVDEAGVEVGVDRHLLTGHRVEGEARRDLGDASGTVRDHDELDHDEDQEDDEADDHRAADDEVAERLDDLARVAVQQHEPGDRHVQREPEQRRDEEVRREDREVEDARREHAREEREQWRARCS